MHVDVSSAKWPPFCSGLNVFTGYPIPVHNHRSNLMSGHDIWYTKKHELDPRWHRDMLFNRDIYCRINDNLCFCNVQFLLRHISKFHPWNSGTQKDGHSFSRHCIQTHVGVTKYNYEDTPVCTCHKKYDYAISFDYICFGKFQCLTLWSLGDFNNILEK